MIVAYLRPFPRLMEDQKGEFTSTQECIYCMYEKSIMHRAKTTKNDKATDLCKSSLEINHPNFSFI